MILHYLDFINESYINYTDEFFFILINMNYDNKILSYLKDIFGNYEKDLKQNYFDISTKNNTVLASSDKKAMEYIKSGKCKYFLKYSDTYFYNGFGIDANKLKNQDRYSSLTILKISDDEKYFLLQGKEEGTYCIVNAASSYSGYPILPKKLLQEIKIGRAVRTLLDKVKIKYTDQEIEEFVNLYKSTFDKLNPENEFKFELVEGEDIGHYYNNECYLTRTGQLGNSCMSDVDEEYFQIYTQNRDVCQLLIYKSGDKIKGRALIWKNDEGKYLMDRVYTNNDSDISLFKSYALDNGWYYKVSNDSNERCSFINVEKDIIREVVVHLSRTKYDAYPYLDTLKYIDLYNKVLTNNRPSHSYYYLESTEGGISERTCENCEGEGEFPCENCEGSGYIQCYDCDGEGYIDEDGDKIKCSNCDGSGEVMCSTCHGDGKEECYDCGGTGVISE